MQASRRDFIKAGAVTLPGMLLLNGCAKSVTCTLPNGCPSTSLIIALDVAEVAISAALPFVGQLGPAWGTYLKAMAAACSDAVTTLGNTSLTKAQQYEQIALALAQIIQPDLPSGGEVLTVVEAVIGAVQAIIAIVGAPKTGTVSLKASRLLSAAAQNKLKAYQAQVKALGSDKARIADIVARASMARAAMRSAGQPVFHRDCFVLEWPRV